MNKRHERWLEAQKEEELFWDTWNVTEEEEKKWKMKFIPNIDFSDKVVLDVGCGPKGVVHYIRNECKIKIGLDPLIDVFWGSGGKFKPDTLTIYIRGSAEKIPLKSESIDVAFCINVLDHTENPILCLKEMHRVLKSNGILIFEINVFLYPIYLYHVVREKLNWLKDIPHPHSYTFKKIRNLLNLYFQIKFATKIINLKVSKAYSFYCNKK